MIEFFSNPTLILGITTPITLIAFFLSIYFGFKYRKSKHDIKKLRDVPEAERSELIKSLQIDYPSLIELNNLSKEQRFILALEQIKNKESERQRNFYLTLFISIILLVIIFIYLIFSPKQTNDQNSYRFDDLHIKPISTKGLNKVEKQLFIQVHKLKPESIKYTIVDTYYRANNQLVDYIKKGINTQEEIFISAPAGYGKSTFIQDLCDRILKSYSKINLIEFNREKNLFNKNETDLTFEDEQGEGTIGINSLPYLDYHLFRIDNIFSPEDLKKRYLIIDDLDEVHPKLAQHIIQKTFDFINTCQEPKTFILIGRPEVFNEYMRLPDFRKDFTKQFKTFELEPISCENYDNLLLRVENYSIRNSKNWNQNEINKRTSIIFNYTNRHKFLSYTFPNLSLCNIIISKLDKSNINPNELKKIIFNDLLERANNKHFRPDLSKPTQLDLYLNALEFVAVKYIDTDSKGYFTVQSTDYISFSSQQKRNNYKSNIMSLLNRSGLITVQPFNDRSVKYRFEPFWVHEYLVNSYNSKCKR